jgi:hypothetical protein
MPSRPQKRKVGITHFPIQSEQARQEKVSPPGTKQADPSRQSSRGHRLSREQKPASSSYPEGAFLGKGGKGGKTRGSRAGLLSSSRKVRARSR